MFVVATLIFSSKALKCVSMNHKECKISPHIININSNKSSLYACTIEIKKCSDSCNNINDLYAKLYVPDVVKKNNVREFNLVL